MIKIAVVDDKINNRKVITDKLSRNDFFKLVFQAVNGKTFSANETVAGRGTAAYCTDGPGDA